MSLVHKKCPQELVYPLTDFVNSSFLEGMFPSQLKLAEIHPLF